ncbi:MAG: hypothetical protein JJE05_05495 [Actinobacteria bacterium]|nr:hypothetical protein [Actinomycetota bacterium]
MYEHHAVDRDRPGALLAATTLGSPAPAWSAAALGWLGLAVAGPLGPLRGRVRATIVPFGGYRLLGPGRGRAPR